MIAWHYTTGDKFLLILASGLIKPATVGVVAPERPIVWLSTNQKFEMTARKGLISDGRRRDATIEEMRSLAGGVYRLGMNTSKLIPWRDLPPLAAMHPDTVSGLRRAAKRMGAEPREWFASLEEIPIKGLMLQAMNENRAWRTWVAGAGV